MLKKNSLPIKKSKEEIDFYLENGPKFGQILKDIYKKIYNRDLSNIEQISTYYEDCCFDEFRNISFPFDSQLNDNDNIFGSPICLSKNDCVAHGKAFQINENDIVSLDFGLSIISKSRSYNFDAAFTIKRGPIESWINTPLDALKKIIAIQPGDTYELGSVIEDTCYKNNLSNIVALTGHGIGYDLHEAPVIHNAKGNYQREKLYEGIVFCAEPIFTKGPDKIEKVCLSTDGWSIYTQSGAPASHFETMFAKIDNRLVDVLGMTEWSI